MEIRSSHHRPSTSIPFLHWKSPRPSRTKTKASSARIIVRAQPQQQRCGPASSCTLGVRRWLVLPVGGGGKRADRWRRHGAMPYAMPCERGLVIAVAVACILVLCLGVRRLLHIETSEAFATLCTSSCASSTGYEERVNRYAFRHPVCTCIAVLLSIGARQTAVPSGSKLQSTRHVRWVLGTDTSRDVKVEVVPH